MQKLQKYSQHKVDSLTDVEHRKNYQRWLNKKMSVAKVKQKQLKQMLWVIARKRDRSGLTAEQILEDLVRHHEQSIELLQRERDAIEEARQQVSAILSWQLNSS